jgi:hypothetical protein
VKTVNEARWWREHFPTPGARDAADKTIDELSIELPMSKFIDTWIEAYVAAGGKTPLVQR